MTWRDEALSAGFSLRSEAQKLFLWFLCVSVCEQLVLTSAPKAAGWALLQDSRGATGRRCGGDPVGLQKRLYPADRSFGEIKGGNAQQGSVQSWLWFVSCCWAMQGRSASQNSRGTPVGLIPGRMEQVSPDHCCSPLALQRGLQWNSWEPREPLFVGNHHHQAFFHGSKSRVCWGEQHFDPSG